MTKKENKNLKKESDDFKGRLRIAGREINGHSTIEKALARIKGIGPSLAHSIAKIIIKKLKVDENEKIGNLTDEQLDELEKMIYEPKKMGIPEWMLNRKNDPETGENKHLLSSDLDFQKTQDVKGLIKIKAYRGVRHMHGLTSRGQRTKTSGRKGLTLGVQRKKTQPSKAKPATGAKKKK